VDDPGVEKVSGDDFALHLIELIHFFLSLWLGFGIFARSAWYINRL
jgi:hypothetical protein